MATNKKDYHLERMEFHRRELEKIMHFGEDHYEPGTVLFFEKAFIERGRNTKRYKYTALKTKKEGKDCWYTSGPRNPGPFTWDELISFISSGVDEIKISHPASWDDFFDNLLTMED